jgi:hypothetical protein
VTLRRTLINDKRKGNDLLQRYSFNYSLFLEAVDYPHSKLIKLQAFGELDNRIQ